MAAKKKTPPAKDESCNGPDLSLQLGNHVITYFLQEEAALPLAGG